MLKRFDLMEWRRWVLSVLILGVAVGLLGRCDTSVDVVRSSKDYQYSLYGVLDVAADTQFIRVEPIGDKTQLGTPREIEAEVYLEDLSTETEVELRDSIATVRSNTSSHTAQVHVFWTTRPIRAGTRYRLRVEEGNMTVTSARTTTPPNAPELRHGALVYPCCPDAKEFNTVHVYATAVDRIAAVHAIYPFRGGITVNYSDTVQRAPSIDGFDIPIYYPDELKDLNWRLGFGSRGVCVSIDRFKPRILKVMVAAGGNDWPDWRGLPFRETVSLDGYSNVKGGHGFVRGIYSDTASVPVKSLPGCP